MKTLYRKYRPQKFNEIFGQEAIVKVLKKQVHDKKVGHAYLFSGPRGTGKTTIARLLAKAVNCEKLKDGNPCNRCQSCNAITNGRFLDLIEIDAASNRGIDEIRRLRERVTFSPSEGEYKVYIIDEVHMLTKDAFNALLKTLEEPPLHVIFILATTEPYKIPPTILSRCQRFNFVLADENILIQKLKYICKKEGVDFSKEALGAIVKNAGGSFRDAESILEKVLGAVGVVSDKKIDFEDVKDILGLVEINEIEVFIEELLKKNASSSINKFHELASSGVNLFQFLRQSLEYLRELLLLKVSKKDGDFSLHDLVNIISELSEAESRLRLSQVRELPIEMAIVKICSLETGYGSKDVRREPVEVKNSKRVGKKKFPQLVTNAIGVIPRKLRQSSRSGKKNDISLDKIREKWEDVIDKIKPFNHHLSAFFKKAYPVKLRGDKLILEVPFRFHKQRIENIRSQEVFSKTSKEILGLKLSCVCSVVYNNHDQSESTSLANNGAVVLEVLGDMIE